MNPSESVRALNIPEPVFDGLLTAGFGYVYTNDIRASLYLGAGAGVGFAAFKALVGDAGSNQDRFVRTAAVGGAAYGASLLLSGYRPDPLESALIGVAGHIAAQTLLYGDLGVGTVGPLVL